MKGRGASTLSGIRRGRPRISDHQLQRRLAFGQKLRAERQMAGLTIADAARAIRYSPAVLEMVEHGERSFPSELLTELAGVLGVSPIRLITETPIRQQAA